MLLYIYIYTELLQLLWFYNSVFVFSVFMCAPAVVLLHMMKDDRFIDRVATLTVYKVLSIPLLCYAIDSGQNIEGDIFS